MVIRQTKQRTAVAELLANETDFRSAQQIHALMREDGSSIGLATVYRTLQSMAEAKTVDVLHGADGESLYRLCAEDEHHHHLVCRVCRATVEVVAPPVEDWAHSIAAEHGYAQVSHTIEIFGVCPACAAAARAAEA
ncbi:transcriptional repressor [Micrococcales bacterium 31B]|nr:transcriptional repressor [Micrococcales bacterium 31B]